MNKCFGVAGALNCQDAGWREIEKKARVYDVNLGNLTGSVFTADVNQIAVVAGPN